MSAASTDGTSGPSGAGDVLELRSITKRFGGVPAVDQVSFSIRAGEVFTLLGPSGCGKTTTLRLVAGLEQPDDGTILLNGRRGTPDLDTNDSGVQNVDTKKHDAACATKIPL